MPPARSPTATDTLACRCGSPDCPAAGRDTAIPCGDPGDRRPIRHHRRHHRPARHQRPPQRPHEQRPPAPALLLGHGVLPNTAASRSHPQRRHHQTDPHARAPNPNRGTDPATSWPNSCACATCSAASPAATVAADRCDLDHARPWPWGPTHASNLNCKCRKHHLMKTFWTGIGGWADQQLPDGTVIWTAPSGKTYTTHPGSRLFFPTWNVTPADLPPPPTDGTTTRRGRSRADDAAPKTHPRRRQRRTQSKPNAPSTTTTTRPSVLTTSDTQDTSFVAAASISSSESNTSSAASPSGMKLSLLATRSTAPV